MASNLKPNTWFWFHCPNGETYVEGVTELHEGTPENANYSGWVRTDENGSISVFKPIGDAHVWNRVPWPKGS